MLQAWTAEEVETLIGVPQRTVRRWLAQGLVCLRLHRTLQPRERLRFVQDDIENLWVIACLRHQGVSMQRLRGLSAMSLGRSLSDFSFVMVDEDETFVACDEHELQYLLDGPAARQIIVDITTIRERLTVSPGERLGEAWELLLRAEEAIHGDAR